MYGIRMTIANEDELRTYMEERQILPEELGETQLFDTILGCQGEPPPMPNAAQVEYAEGARGPTPNAPMFSVQQMEFQFNGMIVGDGMATGWYRSESEVRYLRAITEFANRYPGAMVATYPISLQVLILSEDNDPDNPFFPVGGAGTLVQPMYNFSYEISRIRPRHLDVVRATTTFTVDALTYARKLQVANYPGAEPGRGTTNQNAPAGNGPAGNNIV